LFERPDAGNLAVLVHINIDDVKRRNSAVQAESLAPDEVARQLDAARAEFKELATSAGLEVATLVTDPVKSAI